MINKKITLFICLTTTILMSCDDDPPKILTVDDIVGFWECAETTRTKCDNTNDNRTSSCEGNSLLFNSDNSCTITTDETSFDGTFTFTNNILVLTLDLSDVPSGIGDETLGIVEFAPIEISFNNSKIIYRQTTKDIDECFATSVFVRS